MREYFVVNKEKLDEEGKKAFYPDEVLEYKVQPLKDTMASVFTSPNDDDPNDDDGEFTFNIVERVGKPITVKHEEISYMGTEDNILDADKGYINVTANYIIFKDDRPCMYCFIESKVTRKDKSQEAVMDNKQEPKLKKKLNSLVKRGLYMGTKECPIVVTKVAVEATKDLYDDYEAIEHKKLIGDYAPDYDGLFTGIKVYFSIIGKYADNTYDSMDFSVKCPFNDPMGAIANTEARERLAKYIISYLLTGYDYNNLKNEGKPVECTSKFKFWLRKKLDKKLKHLKWTR